MIATSLASAARPFWRLLDHYNIDPAYVFREAGLDPALMDKPRERYNLFMSPRTLNRKLSALGTNYSKLLEAVRQQLAEQYVSDPSISLSEISFLLGFSELSAFSRAFRRWSGRSPSAAREAAAA